MQNSDLVHPRLQLLLHVFLSQAKGHTVTYIHYRRLLGGGNTERTESTKRKGMPEDEENTGQRSIHLSYRQKVGHWKAHRVSAAGTRNRSTCERNTGK